MEWAAKHYGQRWAPNTREIVRRQTMHQFVAAGIALYNPDDPGRAVNSPKAAYQVESEALALLKAFGSTEWLILLDAYRDTNQSLAARYAKIRDMHKIPVHIGDKKTIKLSPGPHSELIKLVITEFAPRFARNAHLLYVGDTGAKWAYFDEPGLAAVGIKVGAHGKMPDVVFLDTKRNWLLLVEAVTSHGPVDGKRHGELAHLSSEALAGRVYVTAFPNRRAMSRYVGSIAWETEVWCADAPTHLIHFNGERFLGPYPD